jgi:BASS family bile acid:Na+ symporter
VSQTTKIPRPRQVRVFLQAYAGWLPIMETENIVRLLTVGSLAGLLAAVGMRLTVTQVVIALRRRGLGLVVTANFVLVPILVLAATKLCGFGFDITIGMILLAAAPFAPVVPVFARMARADLALAAGLTALFPLLSVLLTPFVCEMALTRVAHAASVQFNVSKALLVLVATIVVPLCLGLLVKDVSPLFARRILRRVEIFSEATGAASLAFVTTTQWRTILTVGWRPLLAMAIVSEICLLLGYWLGGPERGARQVIGLGTSNRNIALALLMALQAFAGTSVVSAVVANGLLLILLGLIHVAFWRFRGSAGQRIVVE